MIPKKWLWRKENTIIHKVYSLLSQCLLGENRQNEGALEHLSRTTTFTPSLFTISLYLLPPTLSCEEVELLTQDGRLSQHRLSFSSLFSLKAFTLLRIALPAQSKISITWASERVGPERVPSDFLSSRKYVFISSRCRRSRAHQSWQPCAANEWT